MNILHIMEDYKPTIGGSVVRNGNMLDAYKQNYPEDSLFLVNMEGNKYERKTNEKGIVVFRCNSLFDQIVTSRKIVKTKNIGIIHAHNFRFLLVAFLAKKRKKQKIVFEIHAVYKMGKAKELLSYWLLRRTEQIIVLADSAKKYLVEKKRIDVSRITTIRNGINCRNDKQNEKKLDLYIALEEIRKQGKIVVSYNGSFIEWQGVRFIADYFEHILDSISNVVLLLIGDGQEFEYVEMKARQCKSKDRIIVHKGVSKDQMLSLYDQIDVILIPREKSLKTDTAVPLKAIEAMQYAKCILASGDEGIKEILNNNNASIFHPMEITDLIDKLIILSNNKALREQLGKQARVDSEKYLVTWDNNSKIVHGIYENC